MKIVMSLGKHVEKHTSQLQMCLYNPEYMPGMPIEAQLYPQLTIPTRVAAPLLSLININS